MTEGKATVKPEPLSALEQEQNTSTASKANNASACYRKLLEETPILGDEDEKLYNQIHQAVFDDVKPQTFLEKIAVKDFADKLFEELRLKTASVDLIEGARQTVEFDPEDRREFRAIEKYLPHLQKLRRMMDNSEASRRLIMKEFRRKSSETTDDPETFTKDKKPH
jgi:hypothetical protein